MKTTTLTTAIIGCVVLMHSLSAIDSPSPYDLSGIDWGDSQATVKAALPRLTEHKFESGTGLKSDEIKWRGIGFKILMTFDDGGGLRNIMFLPQPDLDNKMAPVYNALEETLRDLYGEPNNEDIRSRRSRYYEWSLSSTFVIFSRYPARNGPYTDYAILSYSAPRITPEEQVGGGKVLPSASLRPSPTSP